MKKTITITLVVLLILYISIIQRVTVDAGMEAVIIKKPWFLKESGIEKKAISTGTIWAVRSTTIKLFSLKAFNISESFSELLSSDNIPMAFTVNMSFQNQKEKTPLLLEKFGDNNKWYKTLLLPILNVSLESSIKSTPFQELQANNQIIQTIEDTTTLHIKNFLKKEKIPVDLLQLHINKLTPPQILIDAAIQTQKEKEKLKTKEERIKGEELRKKLEETTAKADKAYMLKMNMSIQQYLQLKRLELEGKKLLNQRYIMEQAKDCNGTIVLKIDMGN